MRRVSRSIRRDLFNPLASAFPARMHSETPDETRSKAGVVSLNLSVGRQFKLAETQNLDFGLDEPTS